jgi:hypothetical protein
MGHKVRMEKTPSMIKDYIEKVDGKKVEEEEMSTGNQIECEKS